MKNDTDTIIKALRVLARDIQSDDGVANAAIAEAADRLQEQQERIDELNAGNERLQGELETGFGIIKEQQERIKQMEEAGDRMFASCQWSAQREAWAAAKKANL